MSRIWMGPNGALLTDEQVLRHIATFGSMSAALKEGDIILVSDKRADAPRPSGKRTGRLADYLGDDLDGHCH